MKFYVIPARKGNWTNKAAREALSIESGQSVKVTRGNASTEIVVKRAPGSASKVMRAVTAFTGLHGIALNPDAMRRLELKAGDSVQVVNNSIATVQRATSRPGSRTVPLAEGKKLSLKDRIAALAVGDKMQVSESAIKSSVYSAARDAGAKVKKVGVTTVERVE
jgi:formylmethanofuran dehydrogenase subunit D